MMQFVYGEGSQKLAQTYVWHKGMRYFVSTIDRDSSSALGGRYAETMVWEWPFGCPRGSIVAQDEHTEGSLFAHMLMVERIRAGQLEADDDC